MSGTRPRQGQSKSPDKGGRAAYKGVMTKIPAADVTRRAARLALPMLLLGAAAISMAGVLVKLSEIGPIATAFYRLLLSLPVFWLWAAGEARVTRAVAGQPNCLRDYLQLSVCGVVFATNLAVWHLALRHTTVANATLLGNTAPIYVTLAGWLLLGERFRAAFLIGLVVAMARAAVLLGGSFTLRDDRFTGDLLGVAAGMLTPATSCRSDGCVGASRRLPS